MTNQYETLKSNAARHGVEMAPGITPEMVEAINPHLMIGHAVEVKSAAQHVDLTREQMTKWADCVVVPYRIGAVGGTVYAPPIIDRTFAPTLYIPAYEVVAHLGGVGETQSDADKVSDCDLTYTVIRPTQ